jgi:thiamine biosynthesis protein ThiS
MQVTINDECHAVNPGTTVGQLIEMLGLGGQPLAVERNGNLVPTASRDRTELATGDRLEIVTLVGGG